MLHGYGCIWDYVLQINNCVHQLKHSSYITHHMGVSEDRVPPQIPRFITIFPITWIVFRGYSIAHVQPCSNHNMVGCITIPSLCFQFSQFFMVIKSPIGCFSTCSSLFSLLVQPPYHYAVAIHQWLFREPKFEVPTI